MKGGVASREAKKYLNTRIAEIRHCLATGLTIPATGPQATDPKGTVKIMQDTIRWYYIMRDVAEFTRLRSRGLRETLGFEHASDFYGNMPRKGIFINMSQSCLFRQNTEYRRQIKHGLSVAFV